VAEPTGAYESFLRRLRRINVARCARWHGPDTEPWTGADWSNAMCGEAGEVANVVKKMRRHETGTGSVNNPSPEALRVMLGDEIADTLIYLDLLAAHYGLDLEAAVERKFDAVSVREGFPERLAASGDSAEVSRG